MLSSSSHSLDSTTPSEQGPLLRSSRRRTGTPSAATTPVLTPHLTTASNADDDTKHRGQHWSVFYPNGLEAIAAPVLHYMHVGAYCTTPAAWDYFFHRQPKKNEASGHHVIWLHTARPRDRFVFVVEPVEFRGGRSLLGLLRRVVYGQPPCFSYNSGPRSPPVDEQLQGVTPPVKPIGVEVIEVRHTHITAMDYYAGLTSCRLSLETQLASTKWFPDLGSAMRYYECEDLYCNSPHTLHNQSFRMMTLPPPMVPAETHNGPSLARLAEETVLHKNTMVTMYTQDPHFNAVLREMLIPEPGTCPFTASVSEQKRLLSLYEAGMPSWTIFVSKYGLPYRRWFRLVAVMIVNLWPLIAVCVGLYDLYKHMPYLKEFLSDTLLPFQEWMDTHFTLRVSMLVTYLVSVSFTVLQSMHAFAKSVIAIVNLVIAPLAPLWQMLVLLQYPLSALWMLITFVFGPFVSVITGLFATIQLLFSSVFGVFSFVFSFFAVPSATTTVQNASLMVLWWRAWLDLWDKVIRPVKNLAKAIYDGVVHVGVLAVRREASIRRWYTTELRKVWRLADASWDIFWTNCRIVNSIFTLRMIVPTVILCFLSVVLLVVWWFNAFDLLPLENVSWINPF